MEKEMKEKSCQPSPTKFNSWRKKEVKTFFKIKVEKQRENQDKRKLKTNETKGIY